ncbi:hypothetical protein [Thermocoleostomius sinensis]|jgi:hypothetical protein|uniref:UPF0367 protein OXH18_24735 n=1 Tax=Thermocoleostomius sinensis A174 TaxID=2016057 RepID=A0A9E9CA10_9CYAN|nr:hypothetical protein [Thermocoleostomius sinensis]WAL60332.1 hypothetical protein OXH18_24735 [Thermocoleostomius sinensis A174]
MFIIDVTLKNTPVALSVQRKSADDAKALYRQILDAMQAGSPKILELTCEQQVGKTVGILVGEISAVQMSEKSSTAAASGRPPGFFALAE